MSSIFVRVAALLVAVLVAASPPAFAQPVALTDAAGRQVTFERPPQRILLGIYFEEFLAVAGAGALDKVVAISRAAWHDWRNNQWRAYVARVPRIADIPDVGEVEAGTFSFERAVAARPDVAILAQWQIDMLGAQVQRLEAAGIRVVVLDYNAQTIEKHRASTLALGAVTGQETRARRLIDEYVAAIEDVRARVARATGPRPRVYLELGQRGAGEYGNSYDTAMWGPMIELAGGDNIAKGRVGRWGPLTAEYVISAQPEVIFLAGSEWVNNPRAVRMGFGFTAEEAEASLRSYLARPGWAALPATRAGRVHAVNHGGVRSLHDYTQVQFLAKALHPTLFADVDPIANLRRFYATYLPVEPVGVFQFTLPAR